MTEAEAKRQLGGMLKRFTPGSVLHLLAEVLYAAEEERLASPDELAAKRVRNAEAALFVFGLGLIAMCPR